MPGLTFQECIEAANSNQFWTYLYMIDYFSAPFGEGHLKLYKRFGRQIWLQLKRSARMRPPLEIRWRHGSIELTIEGVLQDIQSETGINELSHLHCPERFEDVEGLCWERGYDLPEHRRAASPDTVDQNVPHSHDVRASSFESKKDK